MEKPKQQPQEQNRGDENKLPHPNVVYVVIAVAVLLALTIFTPANINAAATGVSNLVKGGPDVTYDIELTSIEVEGIGTTGDVSSNDVGVMVVPASVNRGVVCGDFCEVSGSIGMYVLINGNARCVSPEEFVGNHYCCYSLDCQFGSSCISGMCR